MSAPLQRQIETEQERVTVETVLTRGVYTVMPDTGLRALLSGDPIRVYLGIDPTSPNLHIGHLVPLRKLRQLQLLGHHVILLFGTFTGMIGDPTDKTAARVRLTEEQIAENVATYREQAGMILDLSPDAPNPVEIVYNHTWLENLNLKDLVELASNFTLNEMLTRSTYRDRLASGARLFLHEIFYSLMQGYDSVALAVEMEIGGKDQLTNMLTGRTLMKVMSNIEKFVMGLKLVENPDGTKMGKTTGHVVNITEWSEVIYEAIMSWPDNLIPLGLELLTSVPMEIVDEVERELALVADGKSETNPMHLKQGLAWRVVFELNGEVEADFARDVFIQVKRNRKLPPRIKEVTLASGTTVISALVETGLVADESEAESKLAQTAVFVDGRQVKKNTELARGEHIVELGKNSIKNVRKVIVS